MSPVGAPSTRTVRPRLPVELRLTLGPLRRGRLDPCMRFGPDGVWRATRTAEGPVTTHLVASPEDGSVTMRAWGPGATRALDTLPALIGAGDSTGGFDPGRGAVAALHRRLPGLRIARSGAVVEALVPTILEQRVVGIEARRSYARLVQALGEPAPGPAPPGGPLLLPPSPAVLAATPSWAFQRFGVERKRADTIRLACARAPRVEEAAGMDADRARSRLTTLPGVGAWTAAEVALVALGDPDAVSVGDYHLPDQVAWALAREPRADDARMLELLEPWRGHRGRVIRLVVAGAGAAPRFGPRVPLSGLHR